MRPLRILFVSSEAEPYIKTGGLADAVSGLVRALRQLGHDARLLLPAYPDLQLPTPGRPLSEQPALLQIDTDTGLYLARCSGLSNQAGNPYHDAHGQDWPDNALRFGRFSQLASHMAADRIGLNWRPDIVHCHDWQTGLVPVYMMLQRVPAPSLFTIHNLAYRGLYPSEAMGPLHLPGWLWHPHALEFHGHLSLIKGGLVFADALSTVSPRYAEEIQQAEKAYGLEGILRQRSADLHGVLNGIDTGQWNPATDPALPAHFDDRKLDGKARCKAALQKELGLPVTPDRPLLAVVSRLVEQKGIDLILQVLPALVADGCQLAILGSGDVWLQQQLSHMAQLYPQAVAFQQGFDEGLAHRIEAGADMFVMPSRFEPCGLNQMYSLRYGTPPIVHATGGLADSITDAADPEGTGFVFEQSGAGALMTALQRALRLWQDRPAWRRLQRRGMRRELGWDRSAGEYLEIYRNLIDRRRAQVSLDLGQGPAGGPL